MNTFRVAIIGGGNMGNAVARAFGRPGGLLDGRRDLVVIAEPDEAKHQSLRDAGEVVRSASEAIGRLATDGTVVVAVKPQVFPNVAAELSECIGDRLVISVMAGIMAAAARRELGGKCRVVRAMPNLPVTLGRGVTGISIGPGASRDDVEFTRRVFSAMGHCEEIPESLMDAITAVASSGPAYIFYVAEAMIAAAVWIGFEPEQADKLVRATIDGAAAMLTQSDAPPEELRRRITSKGGTTQAATDVLNREGVADAIVAAIEEARNRGKELAGG